MEHVPGQGPSLPAAVRDWHIAAFRSASLPLYGLDQTWAGTRALGDAQHSRVVDDTNQVERESDEYGLVHIGEGSGTGQAWVEVVTSTPGSPEDQPLGWVLLARVEGDDRSDELGPVLAGHLVPGMTEGDIRISVDGSVETFRQVRRNADWAARLVSTDHVITVQARNFPADQVTLVRITDLKPYVTGFRRWPGR